MNLQEKFAYMKTGKPYNDLDPLLEKARDKATLMTNKLNAESDPKKKFQIMQELFGSVGKGSFVNPNFRCEFGQNIHVGNDFYANYDCTLLDGAPITIGDHVLFGTDAPFAVMPSGTDQIISQAIEQLQISDTEKERIFAENYQKFIADKN